MLIFLWYLHTAELYETPEMSDADLVALKKAAPLIKEMLIAVDKELYARAEVRTVEGVRLVEGRNQRSWKFDDEETC
jgi:hypothetical protein